MSLPSMHTAVGMGLPFLIMLAFFLKTKNIRYRTLLFFIFLMIFCGLWAEIPDIPQLLPVDYRHWEKDILHSRYANVFFFHGFLDKYQTEDRGLLEGFIAIFIMFSGIFIAVSRQILKNKNQIERLNAKINVINTSEKYVDDIVDIHCHILPEVDDGAKSMAEALEMCKKTVCLGFSHIVATPHLPWNGSYEHDKISASFELLKAALQKENISLKLSLGSDIRISWDLMDRLKNGTVIRIADSRYFLLEFDNFAVPDGTEDLIARCVENGFYPVITHPERNIIFQSDIERLKKISKMPVLIQITAVSLSNSSDSKIRNASIEFLKQGLVDVIASDAHSANIRLDGFSEGLRHAGNIIGMHKVCEMVTTTPKKIIMDQPLNMIKSVAMASRKDVL